MPYDLLYAVEYVCSHHSASVTSWWRSEARNKAVGGVATSRHVVGQAIDLVYDDVSKAPSPQQLMHLFPGVKVLREKDHDHFELVRT